MMATVRHVTSSSGLRKFQTDGFLLGGVYNDNLGYLIKRESEINNATLSWAYD